MVLRKRFNWVLKAPRQRLRTKGHGRTMEMKSSRNGCHPIEQIEPKRKTNRNGSESKLIGRLEVCKDKLTAVSRNRETETQALRATEGKTKLTLFRLCRPFAKSNNRGPEIIKRKQQKKWKEIFKGTGTSPRKYMYVNGGYWGNQADKERKWKFNYSSGHPTFSVLIMPHTHTYWRPQLQRYRYIFIQRPSEDLALFAFTF